MWGTMNVFARLHGVAIVMAVLLSGCGSTSRLPALKSPPVAAIPGKSQPVETTFRGCPPWGSGGEDPFINQLKNRVDRPTRPKPMTFAQIEHLDWPPGITDVPTARWSPSARARIFHNEGMPVSFVGYVSAANSSGPEPANCGTRAGADWHLWLGAHPHALHALTFFAESTERVRAREKGFNLERLRLLAAHGTKVRVTGWLMFDSEHPEQPGDRATLWELHPVTAIDVWMGVRWRRIAG
ncbi:MAG: hypothetical protein NVS2B16_27420 [Chloroflexota bacterium]